MNILQTGITLTFEKTEETADRAFYVEVSKSGPAVIGTITLNRTTLSEGDLPKMLTVVLKTQHSQWASMPTTREIRG